MAGMAKKTGRNETGKEHLMMSKLKEQADKIERMRAHLHDLVLEKQGNMIDHEVGDLSTQLDQLIVEYQKIKASIDNSDG